MPTAIPSWARSQFSKACLQKIETTIENAETSTSAEIVAMLVRRSSTTGHVPMMIFLLVWLVCEVFQIRMWLPLVLQDWYGQALIAGAAIICAATIGNISGAQRLFTNFEDRLTQVTMRAEVEFFEAGLHTTSGKTGLLIFISLMEHQVVVLADESISARHPPDTWDQVVKTIVGGIKSSNLSDALASGVQQCGQLLAKSHPRDADDRNELKNHLIFKE